MDERLDTLTGLRTRSAVNSEPEGTSFLFINLLAFRETINEPYGHDIGDQVIREVVLRIGHGLSRERLFRVAGTAFAVAFQQPVDAQAVRDLADRLETDLRRPLPPLARPLGIAMGFAFVTPDEEPLLSLVRAEQAQWRARISDRRLVLLTHVDGFSQPV